MKASRFPLNSICCDGMLRAVRSGIVEEFVDVETAKQAGRAAFGEMVAFPASTGDD